MLFRHFHKQTSNTRDAAASPIPAPQLPTQYKEYPRFPAMQLPAADFASTSLTKTLGHRVTARSFENTKPLTLNDLSVLSSAAMKETPRENISDKTPSARRPAPSGGGLYPLELYLVVHKSEEIDAGIYHYNVRTHSLEKVRGEDALQAFEQSLIHEWLREAPVHAILTGIWNRAAPIYGEYAYRNALLEAGHVAQNMLLTATAENLSACPITGFVNEEVDDSLNITHDDEDSLYIIAFGK